MSEFLPPATSQCHAPNDEPGPEAQTETTPALPERKTPPDCERVVITDRTNAAARKLIESVFSEGG